jgi:hypothetical protein
MYGKLLITVLASSLMMGAPATSMARSGEKSNYRKVEKKKKKEEARLKALAAKSVTKTPEWNGLFTVSREEKDNNVKWYFTIPDSLVGRLFQVVTRYTSTPGMSQEYGGEMVNNQTIYFERISKSKLNIRTKLMISYSDSTQNIGKAVLTSTEDPIVASLKIENPGSAAGIKVEVTSLFAGDNAAFSIHTQNKKGLGLSRLQPELSYIKGIKTFPTNTEIQTVKTYAPSTYNTQAAREADAVTYGLNTSFVLLPEKPMQARIRDPRVGYFTEDYYLFSDDQQKVKNNTMITRWRLEPKPEDVERWKAGELVEPQKPIVYYIDPATPKQWVPYLIAGINDWQVAFEQAGFKNAIIGKEWPNDSTMSMEDARFSVLRYLASSIENAYGPHVSDPRSGEIIESHICWYHNVMKLLHDWYAIQAGLIDKRAQKVKLDDELMGQLIRFVSSHEVGHTLGLRHNMGSSSRTPVDSLRNKAWVEAHGHTASIMDYARFNYVAQPEDSISTAGLFPRINDYDKWAIEWGYGPSKVATTQEEDRLERIKMVTERLAANPRLWYGSGETSNTMVDPRCQREDLGDDNMKASEYGIRNLKRIVEVLPEWTVEEGDFRSNLEDMYDAVVGQYLRYMGHVASNIGRAEYNISVDEAPCRVFVPVPLKKQKEALAFLNTYLFTEPTWLLNPAYIDKIEVKRSSVNRMFVLRTANLVNASNLERMDDININYGGEYSVAQYLDDLYKLLFKELTAGQKVSSYRRAIQKQYVAMLIEDLQKTTLLDWKGVVRQHLVTLYDKTKAAKGANVETRAHWQSINASIYDALYKK